jgi:competence protein ComEC
LLLGDRSLLDAPTTALFRRAGASHVLALSGMHLGIIVTAISALCAIVAGRRLAAIPAAVFALLFLWLIGPRPSLVRAAIMLIVGMTLRSAGLRITLVELVAASFVIHLIVQPAAASDIGFQLSYCALAGMALLAPWMVDVGRPFVPAVILLPLSVGVAAQLATAPLVLSTFGAVQPIGAVSSIVITPLVMVFMGIGATTAGLGAVLGKLPAALTAVVEAAGRLVERVVWLFASAPPVYAERQAVTLVVSVAVLVTLASALARHYRTVRWTGIR